MSSKNVQHFWFEVEASTKNGLYFCRTYLVTELNHTVFAIGHLNDIYYFKCSINSELKCGMFGINPTEPTSIWRIFGNVLVFLIKPNSCSRNRKLETKQEKNEEAEDLPGLPATVVGLIGPAHPTARRFPRAYWRCAWRAHSRAAATSCFHLLLPPRPHSSA